MGLMPAVTCREPVARWKRRSVDIFQPGEFDLVLMDGYEASRQIRRQDGCWILKSI